MKNSVIDTLEMLKYLEDELIDANEFYRLLDKDKIIVNSIVEIVSKSKQEYRHQLFERLVNSSSVEVVKTKKILEENPFYYEKSDKLFFILDRIVYDKKQDYDLISLLIEQDFVFNDKELLQMIIDNARLTDQYYSYLTMISHHITSDIYKTGVYNRYLKTIFFLKSPIYIDSYLNFLESGVLERYEYMTSLLLDYYNTRSNNVVEDHSMVTKNLIDNNRFDSIENKINNILKGNIQDDEKQIKIHNIFSNINLIDEKIMNDDVKFNYLLSRLDLRHDDFYLMAKYLPLFLEHNYEELYKAIFSLSNFEVKEFVFRQLSIHRHWFITPSFVYKLHHLTIDEVCKNFMLEAIRTNDKIYINRESESYDEVFSNEFILFMKNNRLNREELLALREKISAAPRYFSNGYYVVEVEKQLIKKQRGD